MLTASQVATVAYIEEDGDGLLCEQCADGLYTRNVSQYEASEWHSSEQEGRLDWDYADRIVEHEGTKYATFDAGDTWHAEACACEDSLYCVSCSIEILESYEDSQCAFEGPEDEEDLTEDPEWQAGGVHSA